MHIIVNSGRMDMKTEVQKIEAQLAEAGITLNHFYRASGITATTWIRWRSGTMPQMRKWITAKTTAENLLKEAA